MMASKIEMMIVNLPGNIEINVIRNASIREIIFAINIETKILCGDNHIVMLYDDIIRILTSADLFHITLEIVVGHLNLEL